MLSKMFGASQKASAIAAGFLCSMCLTLTLANKIGCSRGTDCHEEPRMQNVY